MSELSQLDEAQLGYLQLLLDAGCKLKWRTYIFQKPYVWMIDSGGTWFLERIPENA